MLRRDSLSCPTATSKSTISPFVPSDSRRCRVSAPTERVTARPGLATTHPGKGRHGRDDSYQKTERRAFAFSFGLFQRALNSPRRTRSPRHPTYSSSRPWRCECR
jgi:hypothetical protein